MVKAPESDNHYNWDFSEVIGRLGLFAHQRAEFCGLKSSTAGGKVAVCTLLLKFSVRVASPSIDELDVSAGCDVRHFGSTRFKYLSMKAEEEGWVLLTGAIVILTLISVLICFLRHVRKSVGRESRSNAPSQTGGPGSKHMT